MGRYYLEYDIEYADGTTGHGSHGEFDTYREALDAKKELRDRKYTSEELEYTPMYTNISVEEDEDYEEPEDKLPYNEEEQARCGKYDWNPYDDML